MNPHIVLNLTILLACQLAGEVIARLLRLPVPGPVIGMVILCGALLLRADDPEDVGAVTGWLRQKLERVVLPGG